MGYCISQIGGEFFLPFEHVQKALKAIKAKTKDPYGDAWRRPEFREINVLQDMFEYWGYGATTDEDGNIVRLSFCGEKLGDEVKLFEAVAPFVKPGSYLEMSGEEGHLWRWVFDGQTCKEVKAEVSFQSYEHDRRATRMYETVAELLRALGKIQDWDGTHVGKLMARLEEMLDDG